VDFSHSLDVLLSAVSSPCGYQSNECASSVQTTWRIKLNIPDEFARQVLSEGKEPARISLEALALEDYRTELLSESALRQMLGFETRLEVHAFLKEHGVYLHYDVSDLDQDKAAASSVRQKRQDSRPSN